jgi:hypothetical protein
MTQRFTYFDRNGGLILTGMAIGAGAVVLRWFWSITVMGPARFRAHRQPGRHARAGEGRFPGSLGRVQGGECGPLTTRIPV